MRPLLLIGLVAGGALLLARRKSRPTFSHGGFTFHWGPQSKRLYLITGPDSDEVIAGGVPTLAEAHEIAERWAAIEGVT